MKKLNSDSAQVMSCKIAAGFGYEAASEMAMAHSDWVAKQGVLTASPMRLSITCFCRVINFCITYAETRDV